MTHEEAREAAFHQSQLDKLESLLIYALRNGIQPSAEAATHGLLRLGARQTVESYLNLYARELPPFEPKRPVRRHRKREGER